MKVTVLIENTTQSTLFCEHGLSLFIEYNDHKILLDAGQSEKFNQNAKSVGVDISALDFAVLSHGHYDHSGGFTALFRENSSIKVYARKEAIERYWSGNGDLHQIGVPIEVLEHKNRFELVDTSKKICDGIYLVEHSAKNLSAIGERTKLYKEVNNMMVSDDFIHEHSLVFDTPKGLVIFNSCSHAGLENIINEVQAFMGPKSIYAYVGGLHIKGTKDGIEICTFNDEEMDNLCKAISKVEKVYTGHCTGEVAMKKLKEKIPQKLISLYTGLTFEI